MVGIVNNKTTKVYARESEKISWFFCFFKLGQLIFIKESQVKQLDHRVLLNLLD